MMKDFLHNLRFWAIVAGGCAVLFWSCAAHAEFWDGNKLHARMNGTVAEQWVALGYVTGVADALMGVTHCAPEGVTAGQLRDMVKNNLEANPSIRHFPADALVSRVLKSTWPCPERQQGRPL